MPFSNAMSNSALPTPDPATPPPGDPTPSALCSSHCQLMELLQVCPNGVLDEVKRAMQHSGYSFMDPVCGSEGGGLQEATCIPVQTPLFAIVQPIGTIPGGRCLKRGVWANSLL